MGRMLGLNSFKVKSFPKQTLALTTSCWVELGLKLHLEKGEVSTPAVTLFVCGLGLSCLHNWGTLFGRI